MKLKWTAGLALAALVCSSVAVQGEEFQVTDNWVMEITPAQKVSLPAVTIAAPPAADGENAGPTVVVDPQDYIRVYNSIPFNRAEYNANPNYRHDSAMEILTGNPRHQTIVEHTNARPEPVVQNPPYAVPYRYNNPDLGLNYYFYFPYWNFRGYY